MRAHVSTTGGANSNMSALHPQPPALFAWVDAGACVTVLCMLPAAPRQLWSGASACGCRGCLHLKLLKRAQQPQKIYRLSRPAKFGPIRSVVVPIGNIKEAKNERQPKFRAQFVGKT